MFTCVKSVEFIFELSPHVIYHISHSYRSVSSRAWSKWCQTIKPFKILLFMHCDWGLYGSIPTVRILRRKIRFLSITEIYSFFLIGWYVLGLHQRTSYSLSVVVWRDPQNIETYSRTYHHFHFVAFLKYSMNAALFKWKDFKANNNNVSTMDHQQCFSEN